jgi:hypothetical protein
MTVCSDQPPTTTGGVANQTNLDSETTAACGRTSPGRSRTLAAAKLAAKSVGMPRGVARHACFH